MDRRVPALFAVAVALILLASPIVLSLPAEQPTYKHSIERVDQSAIPAEATIFHYDNLSPAAQTAIDDTLTGDGAISGRANKPPEFSYSDAISVNHGIYFVEYQGDYFRLTTFTVGGVFLAGLLVNVAMVALGLVVGVVGVFSYGTDRYWLPLGFGSFGLLVLLASRVAPVANWMVFILAASGAGILAAVSAVGAIVEQRSVIVAVTGGVTVIGMLVAMRFLGVMGPVPRLFVSLMFLVGLGSVVGALGLGHLLGVGYQQLRQE